MAIVGTMATARSKGECVTHAKSLILKVVGSQQLASIFCRKLLLAPPKPQNFPAARAQGGGLRPGSATLTATIIHAGPDPPSMPRGPACAVQEARVSHQVPSVSTDGVWSSCAASRVFVQRLRAPELLDSIGEQADDQTMTRI